MIQRIRIQSPSGDIIRDVDHGGGPFGDEDVRVVLFNKGSRNAIPGGMHIAFSADRPMSNSEANRRYRERVKAGLVGPEAAA